MAEGRLNGLSREETMNLALLVGKVLLKNGAETSRVEDTMSRLCHNFGVYDLNVFVTPTVIILGDEKPSGDMLICRIRFRSTNLDVISQVNEFSYNINSWPMDYKETVAYFENKLEEAPPFSKGMVCMASAIGSAGFSAMLGGNGHDFLAAFVTGGAAMFLLKQLGGYRPSAFWENALAGMTIGAVALICCMLSIQCTMENIIVGALMPFLPGVAFTNGLRDYMAGDLISGNSRIAEALLFATSIAIGLAFSLLIWYHWGWQAWK